VTIRPGPLKAAAALAAGFVAVRVAYRVLFHGADGSGAVVWDLPAVRLPPPFAHVELLGRVSVDGLTSAALSAAPIALVILAFGVLNAVFDVSRLFARAARRGPFRGIGRALAVAWASLPALADAVRSARLAQRLRGERGGTRLLAPILERTLERATAVAAALELRGYAGRELAGRCAAPVAVRAATVGFGARIRIDDLTLEPGTLVTLTGPTGSGKSAVLRALAGLHSHVDGGRLMGDMRVAGHDRAATPPRDTSRTVGVVLQDPRGAFATDRVSDEIGLALELRGVAPAIVAARVREVAERVGVSSLRERPLRELSAGQATLVAIAAAIVEQPILLLVDEPLADLDAGARGRIVTLLGALAHEAGICVVVAEHRAAELTAVTDRHIAIAAGEVRELRGATPPEPEPIPRNRADPGASAPDRRSSAPPVLEVTALTVRRGERDVVHEAGLRVSAGEILVLRGPNGAGKSSLLQALALPRAADEIRVDGSRPRARSIALVPDASNDLFVRDTVDAECRAADRRAGAAGATAERFTRLLGVDAVEFARLRALHPRDLSVGQRRCLAIALQSAGDPRVLLLDEPTRGLDPVARVQVARAITARADAGVAVVLATHDASFAAALADRIIPLIGGRLQVPTTRESARAGRADTTRETARMSAFARETGTYARSRASTASTADAARADETDPTNESDPTNEADESDPTNEADETDEADPTARGPRARGPRALGRPWRAGGLAVANLAALAAFVWPLVASAVPAQAQAAVPYIALALAPLAVVLVFAALDESVRSAHTLALLAVLAAIGAAIRIAGTGVGGVEALFVLLILAGRAYGPRFGLLLGAASIALSAVVWGGIGPWLPFQMFACGWVGAGSGMLPRSVRGVPEIVMLAAYGIVSSYLFGLLLNMWFWPFAVGSGSGISYVPGASLAENLANFLVYSFVTSTAGWDTLRAVTTVIGLAVVGRAILAALRRSSPVAAPVAHPAPTPTGAAA